MKKIFLFLICLNIVSCFANNISITNLRLTGQDTAQGFTFIEFDLSWENSWRTDTGMSNRDAAWVFAKFRTANGDWQHAWLNNAGHFAPAGSSIDAGLLEPSLPFNPSVNPGLGVFICRNSNGNGTLILNKVRLKWNYGSNGLPHNSIIDVRIFAVEMVFVPQGSFDLGSGGKGISEFFQYPDTSLSYKITSEAAVEVGTVNGYLYYAQGTYGGDQSGPVPDSFPKGYNAFYCMKYEISQKQYVDFLNNLNQAQANNRKTTFAGYRYGITGDSVGYYTTSYPWVACNYLSWADITAYLDWAGLRPMTEFEFEKACRGAAPAFPKEYAWGNFNLHASPYTLNNAGSVNEFVTNPAAFPVGNSSYNVTDGSIDGPLRTGIFATNSSTRVESGATFYGIMDMSGNLWERTVTIGHSVGRAFTGKSGNGLLDINGDADVANWPGTDAIGGGFLGGNWYHAALSLQVSRRGNAANVNPGRSYNYGGRGGRTAP